jgi:cytochrome P450
MSTTATMPNDTAFHLDPHAWFARMRRDHPVWRNPDTGAWSVFRHADALAVVSDPATFSSAVPAPEGSTLFTSSMNFTDDPRHAQLRAMVQKAFTPRRVARLADRIQGITDGLVDDLVAAGSGTDLVHGFSGALPAVVIAELLGVPAADRDRFRAWAGDVVLVGEPDQVARAEAAMQAMAGYFVRLSDAKRADRADDLMSVLTAAFDRGDLTRTELADFGLLMLTAGHETTTSLINNTLRCLDAFPDQRARLAADLDLLPRALEEVLRFRSPVASLPRITTVDVELGGVALPAGSVVEYNVASANRDLPDLADPDRFVIRDTPPAHLGFGYGLHSCLGNALARLEGRIAVTSLLTRLPGIGLDPQQPPRPIPTATLHGVTHMPVRF